jgi:diacylglycerol kinase (ATP)
MTGGKRIRVLLNPSAHSGRARATLDRALRQVDLGDLRLECVETTSARHLREEVGAAQDDESLDVLALAGGDGTVALALDALAGVNRVPLALLPVGSGNDFARHLGVPRRLREALALLSTSEARAVDVGRVRPDGARYCCVASVGLDEVALRIIHRSWLPRSKALNVTAALRALWVYRPRAVRVTWQGGGFEGPVMFVAVTNTRSYGGGFLVSPAARLDDGLLDVCIVGRMGRGRMLWHFRRILQGTHAELPEVTLASSPWVRIEGAGGELPVALDGELPRAVTPVELCCERAAVLVLAPPVTASRPEVPCTA